MKFSEMKTEVLDGFVERILNYLEINCDYSFSLAENIFISLFRNKNEIKLVCDNTVFSCERTHDKLKQLLLEFDNFKVACNRSKHDIEKELQKIVLSGELPEN